MVQPVEIEIDGQHNENLFFRPLQRSIRGRFDMMRVGEPMARVKAQEWPVPIPSQRLGIDPDGNGYLLEPLRDAEFGAIREKIEKLGKGLEPTSQEFTGIHLPSWLYWLTRAVESGLAKVVTGKLPATVDGEPRKNFILAKPEPTSVDRFQKTLEAQTTAFNRLADAIEKLASK